jgi:lysophospholipid acyltransferase (LPLAT)-like uncharacterized protein
MIRAEHLMVEGNHVKVRSPFLVRLAGLLFGSGLCVIFRTLWLNLTTTTVANPYASCGPNRYLFCVWHDSSVIAAFGGKHDRTVALTSCHRDGSFVATVAGIAGVTSVRGSTGITGGRALRELLRVAQEKDIVITPDGPRGPSRTISRGIIFLSSRTGNAIVPTAFACSRCWRIPGSWSSLVVPVPFSQVILLAGDPIHVPPKLEMLDIDQYVSEVQRAMDRLDEQALNRLR